LSTRKTRRADSSRLARETVFGQEPPVLDHPAELVGGVIGGAVPVPTGESTLRAFESTADTTVTQVSVIKHDGIRAARAESRSQRSALGLGQHDTLDVPSDAYEWASVEGGPGAKSGQMEMVDDRFPCD
jgi:hypothetical protein